MKLYKLTDENDRTRNNTQWGEGVANIVLIQVEEPMLCTEYVIHAYRDLALGLLLNPIHARIKNIHVWEADGDVVAEDWGKVGCYKLTTTKQLPLPDWYTNEQRRKTVYVIFAILCAREVLDPERIPEWQQWAADYINGTDRTYNAVAAARASTCFEDAARVAYFATLAADTSGVARVATNAALTLTSAADAARNKIDFITLAHAAITLEAHQDQSI